MTRLREAMGVLRRLRWTKPPKHRHRNATGFAKCDCIFVAEWLR